MARAWARAGIIPLALAVSAPWLASAQNYYDPYFSTNLGANSANNQNRTPATTTSSVPDNAARRSEDAAASQTSAPSRDTQDYEPDQIENPDRMTDRSRLLLDDRYDSRDRERSRTDELTPQQRRPRPPSEFETFVSQVADKPLRRFGSNLLVPSARDFTAPPTATVPPDYRMNPGDELIVGLTGSIQAANLRLIVDPNGRVFIPRVGTVTVGGVRYGDVSGVISRQVSRQYRDFRLSVSLGELHGITVYVTGFAAVPGSYTLSSLSTLVNAVLAAGGPSVGGSFRSIQVRRGGRLIADFDLYDLLLKGDKTADVPLENSDVIFIAPVGAQVGVVGSVNNEAVFEARPGQTLNDMLLYAGGVSTVADDSRVLVLNSLRASAGAGGWEQLAPADIRTRTAQRGEVLRVLSGIGIAQPLERQSVLVTLSGEVSKPGRYYVPAGTSLSDVLNQAGGLTGNAYPYATVFTRESVQQQQRQSFERALRDMELLLSTQPLISANRQEGNIEARTTAVQAVIQQMRQRKPEGRLVLDITPAAAQLPGTMRLENNDTVFVPPRPMTVGVFGAVPSPATFEYRQDSTIGEFLKRAGGVQKIGDKSQIFVVRANGSLLAPKRGLGGSGVLGARALPGDLVFVPINAEKGQFWARFRDLAQLFFSGAVSAATIVAVSQ